MGPNARRFASGLLGVVVLGATAPVGADGPFSFHTLTPCRLADTRSPNGPSGGPVLQGNLVPRGFPVQGLCGVPVGARAVAVNVTAVNPTNGGFLTLAPSGVTPTTPVSTVNYAAGEFAIANGAIVPLADQALHPLDLEVYAMVGGSGTVHMVLDVTGYFIE